MPIRTVQHRSASGFTLVELVMVILILALLSAFAVVTLGRSDESRDAAMVQSAQASLQTIVSQGAARMDVTPRELNQQHAPAIRNAVQATVGQNSNDVQFTIEGGRYVMTIDSSARRAWYRITDNGDVLLDNISSDFTGYSVDRASGTIRKN